MKQATYIFVLANFINSKTYKNLETINSENQIAVQKITKSIRDTKGNLLYVISETIESLENNQNITKKENNLLKKLKRIEKEDSQLKLTKDSKEFLMQEIAKLENYAKKLEQIQNPNKNDLITLKMTRKIIKSLKTEAKEKTTQNLNTVKHSSK